ncbi:MAG: C-GCAxxG-C-C family protein [Desulforhopalus sp.]|jgi:C_GCAxxG_C_C family probable redox protein|nr:C-GCAxxG-C-C family protein [Desulforhopalus sp.]
MNRTIKDKAKIIERALSLGFEYEKAVTGCCQCTIAAIQDALNIQDDAVFKAGSGLTAGGGVSCEGSCGGFTGGVMVMSSVFGRRRKTWDGDKAEKDCAHRMARALLDKFNREYGSSICKTIHRAIFGRDFDLRDGSDREAFEKLGAHGDKCTSVVGKAAAWSTELILEELSNRGMSLKDLQRRRRR